MSPFPLLSDYTALVTQKTPLLDVRAPVECAKGRLPGRVNLPILHDEERDLVGKCYKKGNCSQVTHLLAIATRRIEGL